MLRFKPRVKPKPSEVQIANCAAPNLWHRQPYAAWFWTNLYDGATRDYTGNTGDLTVADGTPVFEETPLGVSPSHTGSDWDLIASSSPNRGLPHTLINIIGYKSTSAANQQLFSHDDGTNVGWRVYITTSNTLAFALGGIAGYDSSISLTASSANPTLYALTTRLDGGDGTIRFRVTDLLTMTTSNAESGITTMIGTPDQVTLRAMDAFGEPFKGVNIATMWFGDELDDGEIAQIERDPFAMIRPARMPGDLIYDAAAAPAASPKVLAPAYQGMSMRRYVKIVGR